MCLRQDLLADSCGQVNSRTIWANIRVITLARCPKIRLIFLELNKLRSCTHLSVIVCPQVAAIVLFSVRPSWPQFKLQISTVQCHVGLQFCGLASIVQSEVLSLDWCCLVGGRFFLHFGPVICLPHRQISPRFSFVNATHLKDCQISLQYWYFWSLTRVRYV